VTPGTITLLVDRFQTLISALEHGRRFVALETLLARGRPSNHGHASFDELRFALWGLAGTNPLPVAALTRMADGRAHPGSDKYWLRLDPASLWADLARVIMAGCGFADLDEQERNEIENTVRFVLFQEGIQLHSDHPERWTIALEQPLPFSFCPPEDAVGMDVAEVLPDHPAALYWRRLLNEIQMALHACPVNVRRRNRGQAEINSVWFWGGGLMPAAAASKAFHTVYANHPVTRGLALLHDCALHELSAAATADFTHDGENILLDWSRPASHAAIELEYLERIAAQLLERVKNQGVVVQLYTGGGAGWRFDRHCRWRRWQRRVPLENYLAGKPALTEHD
jgi:hypothetical protein